jgi:hypothetical protein
MCKAVDMETIQYLMDAKEDKNLLHIGIHWAKKRELDCLLNSKMFINDVVSIQYLTGSEKYIYQDSHIMSFHKLATLGNYCIHLFPTSTTYYAGKGRWSCLPRDNL